MTTNKAQKEYPNLIQRLNEIRSIIPTKDGRMPDRFRLEIPDPQCCLDCRDISDAADVRFFVQTDQQLIVEARGWAVGDSTGFLEMMIHIPIGTRLIINGQRCLKDNNMIEIYGQRWRRIDDQPLCDMLSSYEEGHCVIVFHHEQLFLRHEGKHYLRWR